MDFITILIIAIALGTDAFSMAVCIGATGIRYRQALIISAVILIFHIVMPLIGLSLGAALGRLVGRLASIIGALVLAAIGILMTKEGLQDESKCDTPPIALRAVGLASRENPKAKVAPGFWGIIVLAVCVSLDALTVGFGLGTLQFNIILTVLTVGIMAGLMTAGGFAFGHKLGGWLGDKAQVVGGVILVAIGIKMFFA